jgi:hypothetical protein
MKMIKNSILISLLALLFFALSSCKKDTSSPLPLPLNQHYFGLDPERYIVYNVLEINHDENAVIKHDTLNYQLKTFIGDTVVDNEGRIARKFYRSKRPDIFSPWVITDLWTAIIENNKAELVEENQRMVKLVFPISSSKLWNINQFNSFQQADAYYDFIFSGKTINGLFFDSTVRVEQEKERNLIAYKRKYEEYAANVGLIRKVYKDLTIMNFDTLNVKSGKEIFMDIVEYGN